MAAILAVALIVVVGVRTDWFGLRHDAPPTGTAAVGVNGGTFTFPDGLQVVVPKGAAPDGSTLMETGPTTLDKGTGPFRGLRSAGVRFDVSLKQGGTVIEPKKPVDLIVPLQKGSRFVPNGASGTALPYTPDESGAGYLLLPAKAQGGSQLQIRVAHFSPKYLAYVTDEQLIRSFFPEKALNNPSECKQNVTVGGHKAKIGGNSRGWSLKGDSAIYACLAEGPNGTVAVDIANRIDYILSVASSSNVRLAASSGSADEEITKATASVLFPKDHLKAYLVTDGTLVGATLPGDLPATIELQGDPNTFLAEATWRTLEFLVGFLTGGEGNKVVETVKSLLGNTHIVSCLQKAVSGKSLQDFSGGLDMISGCLGVVTDALYKTFNPLVILEWIVGMANDAWQSGIHFTNGIKLTLANTLRVQVVSDDPAPSMVWCFSKDQLDSATRPAWATKPVSRIVQTGSALCASQWALVPTAVYYTDGSHQAFNGVYQVYDGTWIFVGTDETLSGNVNCAEVDSKVREKTSCK